MSGNNVMIGGRFSVGPRLGAGMQAEVRAGIDNTTDSPVALKIIDKTQLKPRALTALEREICIMKTVAHPNVLSLLAFDLEIEYEHKPVAVLVLELAEGGELFDYLMYSGFFQESIARTYFQQLISALETCHANNVYHRDIKPENILLDSKFQLKLADFGLSNVTTDSDTLLETECGTRSYMAPEIFERRGYNGDTADIWSAGVVLFIMLCGSPPFDIANRKDWWFNAVSLNRYDRFWAAHLRGAGHMRDKTQAMDFINKILVPAVDKRMTIQDMKRHQWFQGESLSEERLYRAMDERKRRVDQAREQERVAAKNAAAATQGRGGAVNVFERDTHRSLGGAICPPIYSLGTNSPIAEFYALLATSDGDLLMRLTKQINILDPNATIEASPTNFSIQATLRVPGETFEFDGEEISSPPSAPISFSAQIYQVDESSRDVGVVGLNRTNGEIFAFQKLFRTLKDFFTPSNDLSNHSADTEEEFSEDIGMI